MVAPDHKTAGSLGLLFMLLALAMTPASLQAQNARRDASRERERAVPAPAPDPTLVFEREIFTYEARGRRDPFAPLTGERADQPRFEELALRGIIYSPAGGASVALLNDTRGRVYRVRVGDVIGNIRVLEISESRVRFAVTNFGVVSREELRLPSRDVERISAASAPSTATSEHRPPAEPAVATAHADSAPDREGDLP